MLVTLSGITTLVRLVQEENASTPIRVTPLPIVTFVRLMQPPNAPDPNTSLPMLMTLSGIVTLVSTCAKINSELAWGGECNSTLATGDG